MRKRAFLFGGLGSTVLVWPAHADDYSLARDPVVWFFAAVVIALLVAILMVLVRRNSSTPDAGHASIVSPPPAAGGGGRIPWTDAPPAGAAGAVLHGFDTNDRAVRFEFSARELESGVVIGRGRDARAVLADEEVGRSHAVLRLASGRLEIKDLGSRNRTYVNGKVVESSGVAMVNYGDRLKFGPIELSLSKA